MSLTQTYYLAHTARSKLSKEAARSEYDLRVLVGHANLLDGLMIELADAEREQESWFNQSIRKAETSTPAKSPPSHISWADTLPPVVEDSSSDESSEDDEDMIDAEEPVVTRKRAPTPPALNYTHMDLDSESDDDDVAEDLESDSEELMLSRISSRSSLPSPSEAPDSPPELCDELSEDDDEDTNTPPSPPTEVFQLDSKTQSSMEIKGAEDWAVVPTQPGIVA